MENEDKLRLGVTSFAEANRIKTELSRIEVEIELSHNEQTCTKGCNPTVEIWAKKRDLKKIEVYFRSQAQKLYEGLDINPELMNQTFDPSKDEATCPACGTNFSTQKQECPDCGLAFSIPEEISEED